jgi:hypothetical protein
VRKVIDAWMQHPGASYPLASSRFNLGMGPPEDAVCDDAGEGTEVARRSALWLAEVRLPYPPMRVWTSRRLCVPEWRSNWKANVS